MKKMLVTGVTIVAVSVASFAFAADAPAVATKDVVKADQPTTTVATTAQTTAPATATAPATQAPAPVQSAK